MNWKNARKYRCRGCRSIRLVKDGRASNGAQRYRCKRCDRVTVHPRGMLR